MFNVKTQLLTSVHPSWQPVLLDALQAMDLSYLEGLNQSSHWLPGQALLWSAFQRPLLSTRYLLLGESPYPRRASANGYAFWDASVHSLWSAGGLSKEINRATSLRNLMKMLLYARGDLADDRSQAAIARLDRAIYHQTAEALFGALLNQGFVLLNASLVYEEAKVHYHANQWRPFIGQLLTQLAHHVPSVPLILFGKIAELIPQRDRFDCLIAEHPYNLSFITNPDVVSFFKPLDLLVDHGK
jgi:uracil-DNA glycosylase